ncbi:MAG TPA: hypothetical protein VI542_07015 [Candidatus Tectomicrobia bacterium]
MEKICVRRYLFFPCNCSHSSENLCVKREKLFDDQQHGSATEPLKGRIDVRNAQVRASLSALQEPVAGLIQRYSAATIVSLTGYASVVEASSAL